MRPDSKLRCWPRSFKRAELNAGRPCGTLQRSKLPFQRFSRPSRASSLHRRSSCLRKIKSAVWRKQVNCENWHWQDAWVQMGFAWLGALYSISEALG